MKYVKPLASIEYQLIGSTEGGKTPDVGNL